MGIKRQGRKKTVLILGIDGYIGWPLANHLKELGHTVFGIDNLFRRMYAEESLIPIDDVGKRRSKIPIFIRSLDDEVIPELKNTDVVIHLAEQPSAPWSMKSSKSSKITQRQNILGTLSLLWEMKEQNSDAHLIKLGTMGEYGTPNCEIPEGFIEKLGCDDYHDCPMEGLMFPRSPNSFYHLSKVFDSMNINFACRTWGLRSTDIMQGIVFGVGDTRFDYDEYFGTVINRFCTQAVAGIPLTVYGKGGQTRGFLPLKDSIECITLIMDDAPYKGEYRVLNQFAKTYTINEIAETVQVVGENLGLDVEIQHIDNPRTEKEEHYFQPKHDKLKKLGYEPNWNFEQEIGHIIQTIIPYKDRINKDVIYPKTVWA